MRRQRRGLGVGTQAGRRVRALGPGAAESAAAARSFAHPAAACEGEGEKEGQLVDVV